MRTMFANVFWSFICLVCLLQSGSAFGAPDLPPEETPVGTDSPAAKQLGWKEKLPGMIAWELQLAEMNYKSEQSPDNRENLGTALERATLNLCLRDLPQTLIYAGNPTEPDCLTSLEKLTQIDPQNPYIPCIREGIDSIKCINGFASQSVTSGNYEGNGPRPNGQVEQMITSQKNEEKINQIKNEIQRQQNELSGLKDQKKKVATVRALRGLYTAALNLACAKYHLSYVESANKADGPQKKASNSFEDVFLQHTRGVSAAAVTRRRTVSFHCMELSKDAEKAPVSLSTALCFREGFYTPKCIDTRRKAPPAQPSDEENTGSSNAASDHHGEGIQEF